MNVTQLLNKLLPVANIEIVVPILPEMRAFAGQPPRNALLQTLQHNCKRRALGFAEQQVYVLQHHDVAKDTEMVHPSHAFKSRFEGAGRLDVGKDFLAAMAAESYKVSLPGFVKAVKSPWHKGSA
jgi:hypothetical protein